MRGRIGVIGGVLLLLVALTGCSAERDLGVVHGSGVVTTETRDAGGFDEVELRGVGQVTIVQGTDSGVKIEAEDNLVPLITTSVSHKHLTIGWKSGVRSLVPTKPVKFTVTLPSLSLLQLSGVGEIDASAPPSDNLKLTVNGSGRIHVDGLQVDELKVEINGLGQVESAGEATRQSVQIDGSGQYQAPDLASKQASLDVNGLGLATVRVAETLDVQIDGSGNVRYYGDPSVTPRIRGLGQVVKLGE